ncbi:UDP-glucose 4-epimerase GalE [Agrobacterium rosae]|uniref:UDP-glucose 4-epimerase GalE n=1 Tax=Agrobacterium rosae TaxID=1972867 RepID=UPI0019D3E298|nr:UDP-glucose 4-epimerase GalE [Agrobacterium rosae]MBN7805990.1 UDP-glucose 4-epimerase GalE [Agrobacterium rosae]
MSIVVTGGAGYIGSHMVWALLDEGEDVIVVDNFATGFRWALPSEVKLCEGDIGDGKFLQRVFSENKIEAIFHFAGSAIVPESVTNPLKYYDNNTGKSRNLIELSIRSGIKYFIFSSTAAVYGTPDDLSSVSEDRVLRPESPYGHSKLMTELMLRHAADAHDLTYTILRYFNVAGADPKGRAGQSTMNATHLIKSACATALGLRPVIEIYGTDYETFDGTCIRDYIHVTDLVHAHLLSLKRMRSGGGSLIANCGYGQGYSVLEVIRAVEAANDGIRLPVTYATRRAGDAMMVVANPSLAKRELEWEPRYADLNDIVQSALSWERSLLKKNSAWG